MEFFSPAPTRAVASATIVPIPPPLTPEQLAALPHDDAGPYLRTTIWTLIGISALFLGMRLYCKVLRHRGLWWDDHILVGAWLCITAESALLTYATTLGYGRHIWDIPFSIETTNKMLLVINIAGSLSLTAATWSKTSFALTLLRLTNGWTKGLIWFIIVTINIAMGLSALFVWVQCMPIQKSWMPFIDGKCWPPTVLVHYNIFSAAYSALMDITLALLPWKLIWGLQMKNKEKIGVAVAMSCGIFAGITAIIKTTKIPAMLSQDSYDGVTLFIWGNAESCVTIIAASIPILRVLVREVKSTARRYYGTNVDTRAYGQSATRHTNLRSQVDRAVATDQGSRSSPEKQDDWSEKSILEGKTSPGRAV